MTDLLEILPNFDLRPYSHLIHSLEKNVYTVADLIVLDPVDIVKDCPLPLSDLKELIQAIIERLQPRVRNALQQQIDYLAEAEMCPQPAPVRRTSILTESKWVKTLDARLDDALGGGFACGHITEIAGER